jgi:hypothetical protein
MDIDRHTFKFRVKRLIMGRFFWALFKVYKKAISKLYLHQYLLNKQLTDFVEEDLQKTLFHNLVVQAGPFKGLKYPEFKSYGSALFAKLAGTYEHVLHKLFAGENFQKYERLIDIGCAEGYYAVGSALINNRLLVMAVDTDQQALNFCRGMAQLNHVSERITYEQNFDIFSVEKFVDGKEKFTLIICDCEGCELEIFSNNISGSVISKCDLVIELHDFINYGTKEILINRFSNTHSAEVLSEIGNLGSLRHLKGLLPLQREIILDERRPTKMEWLLLKRK